MRSDSTESSMPDASTERITSSRRGPWVPDLMAPLVAALPIGVVLLSSDGSIVYANDAARPLWANAHACAAPSQLDDIVARALLAGVVVRDQDIVVESTLPNHGRRWSCREHLRVSATPLCRARHAMDGLLVTLEDVTARKELEHVRPMIESMVRL